MHTNVSWNKENDSAFEFGWINDKCVLVYTLAYANIGRFLNNEKTRPNCSIFRSMLITKSKTIEPSLVIHTIRTVHKGEELKYWYGECYGKHKGG